MSMAALMDMPESWTEYVARITKGVPRDQVAQAAGIHVTGVYRWLRSPRPPRAESAIAFARGLGRSPIEALVAAGYLNEDDTDAIEVHQSVEALSDEDLGAELLQRLQDRGELPRRTPMGELGDKSKRHRRSK